MIRKIVSALTVIMVLVSGVSLAQTAIPYSRYGLGLLQNPAPAFLRGWGNQSAAFNNPLNINYLNPASYAYINFTVFETGLFGSALKVKSQSDSVAYYNDGGISTFALAFPVIKNKMGASIGIMPFSSVSYNLLQENDSVPGIGKSYNEFMGSGNTYAFYIGSGYKIKNLSFGINAAYLFGKLNYSSTLVFPDTTNAYNTLRDESRILGDFLFMGGAQYSLRWGTDNIYSLNFGISGNVKTNISAQHTVQYVRFSYQNGAEIIKDTISISTDEAGQIVLPVTVSAGIMFSKSNHYKFGLNYRFGKWSDYSSFGEKDITTDSWQLSAGMQIVPDYTSYSHYLNLIAYRLGASIGKNYLQYDGQDFPEYEIDFGLGLPMKRVLSEVSFSGEWVHIGKLSNNPLTISNFRLTLGVTLNDRWFQKRKYD